MKNPCGRDCPDRSETCHGACEKYKAWKAENDQQREAIKEFKRQDYALRQKSHLNRRKER